MWAATSESAVSAAVSNKTGYWTDWINVDTRADGTGEFETGSRIAYEQDKKRECYLGCQKPLAVRYSAADSGISATWTDIGKQLLTSTIISPGYGYR